MSENMHYKDYYGSVHFDENEQIFYGKIESIRASVSYESETEEGLKKAFEEAVDDYLELLREKAVRLSRTTELRDENDQ